MELELLHWATMASVIASILVKWLPTPEEIKARRYLIFYNTLRRVSINSPFKPGGPARREPPKEP